MLYVFLESAGVEVWVLGILLLGLAVGTMTGMFGAGGGFIITPLLKVAFGVPYPIAVGSGLLLIVINASQSTYKHWRKGSVDFLLGGLMVAGAIVGTEIGVQLMSAIGGDITVTVRGHAVNALDLVINSLFAVLLSVVAFSIFRETANNTGEEDRHTSVAKMLHAIEVSPLVNLKRSGLKGISVWVPLFLSLFVGVLTGLLGVGGGFVNFPLLVYVIGIPTLVAVGTSSFQIVFASAYGAIRHGAQGHVELILVALLFAGSFAGVHLGVKLSHLFGGRKVRKYFAFVLLVGVALVAWDLVRSLV